MKKTLFTLLVATVGLLFVGSLARSAEPKEPPPAGFTIEGNVEEGLILYKIHCTKCHGKQGKGNGLMSVDLDPKPRDLSDPAVMDAISDWAHYVAVRDGSKALDLTDQMPAAGDILSEQEIHDVVAYTKSLASSDDDDW